MTALWLGLLACGVSQDTSGLVSEEETTGCLVHVDHAVGDLTCTLVEDADGTPVLWFGRDVDAEHPLTIRLRTEDPVLAEMLEGAAQGWNEVLEASGVWLAYSVEETVESFSCALESLEDLPEQVAGFCLASEAEWAEGIQESQQGDAYVTRLNSPCDGTLRGSMTVLHPLWAEGLTEQVLAKALGHLTSVVAIDDDAALMADHWDGATVPTMDIEGSCAAWQYRDRSD